MTVWQTVAFVALTLAFVLVLDRRFGRTLDRHLRTAHAVMLLGMSVALLVVALLLVGCGDEYERGAGIYSVTTPTVSAPSVLSSPVEPEGAETERLSSRQERIARAAKRAARAFLPAYLRFSYGERIRVPAVFPGVLPPDPPRLVPGVEAQIRPRLERGGLSFSGTYHGRVILIARLSDGQVRTLTMARRGRAWAVREVR